MHRLLPKQGLAHRANQPEPSETRRCRLHDEKDGEAQPQILKVALEVCLDLAEDTYRGSEFFHIPGVTNLEADALSRLQAPEPLDFPASLSAAPRAATINRFAAGFWRVAAPPRRTRLKVRGSS